MKIGTFINHGTIIEIESVQTMNLHVDKGELHYGEKESIASPCHPEHPETASSCHPEHPETASPCHPERSEGSDDTAQPSSSGCTQILRRSAPQDDKEGGVDDKEKAAKSTGIKVQPAVVLMLMREMQPMFTQKVDWLSFYSVLLRRRWVDENLRAWCRLVDTHFGVQLDPRTLSTDLRNLGSPDYTRWTDSDKRIVRRKRLAADFDTRLTQYFERKREEVMKEIVG